MHYGTRICPREKEGLPLRTREREKAKPAKKPQKETAPETRAMRIVERAARKKERYQAHQEMLAHFRESPKRQKGCLPCRTTVVKTTLRRGYDTKTLEVIMQKRARSLWRTFMRQVKKVVSFAQRHGKDAKDVLCMLVAILAGSTKRAISVSQWQKIALQ